jgi:hypothetical protein
MDMVVMDCGMVELCLELFLDQVLVDPGPQEELEARTADVLLPILMWVDGVAAVAVLELGAAAVAVDTLVAEVDNMLTLLLNAAAVAVARTTLEQLK